MMRTTNVKRALAAALIVSTLTLAGATPARAQRFSETGYSLDGRFAAFWRENGGLPVFGFPISDQAPRRGAEGLYTSQWLERERFELHPEQTAPYDVLLGRLGDEALRRQGRDWRSAPPETPRAGCRFFGETGRNLCEPFASYWRANGLEFDGRPGANFEESLALFGLPLTAPAMETNSSGATVLTQWFERARFEYLPENADPYKVLLGRLGAELYAPERANLDPTSGDLPTYVQVRRPGWPTALEVPQGFTVDEAASGLRSPRFMALDPADGSLVYGSNATSEVVRLRDADGDGRFETRQLIAGGLPFVHSVAFHAGMLYAAAEDRVVRLGDFQADGRAATLETVIGGLPTEATDLYGHRSRTIVFGPDGKLYLSVGSSCDACVESEPFRATVLRANPDGSELEVFATGLRNSVGIAFRPYTSELWGVDMGRNNLGPNLPPEELNLIAQGADYGWPFCYGARVPDPVFGDAARCARTEAPRWAFAAHWAPLGIAFYQGLNFPAAYQGDALVAFHGSASDQTGGQRVGYNVTRVRFRDGAPVAQEELLRGFVIGSDAWGRPAGLLELPDGSLLVSDDFGGRIFRVRYVGA
jgi:glucose/arabinose dehydrogenase